MYVSVSPARHVARWLSCILIVMCLLACPAQGQPRLCDPVVFSEHPDRFPGDRFGAEVVSALEQLLLLRNPAAGASVSYQTCLSYFTLHTATPLYNDSWMWLEQVQRQMASLLDEQTIDVLESVAGCQGVLNAVEDFTVAWIMQNRTRVRDSVGPGNTTYFLATEEYISLVENLQYPGTDNDYISLTEENARCIAAMNRLDSSSNLTRHEVRGILARLVADVDVLVGLCYHMTSFLSNIAETQYLAYRLQLMWDFLPSEARGWRYLPPSEATDLANFSQLLTQLSRVSCSSMSRLQIEYCPLDGVGSGPLSPSVACALQPDKTSLLVTSRALSFLEQLISFHNPAIDTVMHWLHLSVNDGLNANVTCNNTVAVSGVSGNESNDDDGVGDGGSSALLFASSSSSLAVRCLGLTCEYPLVSAVAPGLQEPGIAYRLAGIAQYAELNPSDNISEVFRCARSCKNLLSMTESPESRVYVALQVVITMAILAAYTYAAVAVAMNWRKIFEALHWRSLVYVNLCILISLVASRLVLFSKGINSDCADGDAAIVNLHISDAPFECQASAIVSSMSAVATPCLTFWQAFIWFSYIRKVTAVHNKSAHSWYRNMKIAEGCLFLVVALLVVVPVAVQYNLLTVSGQPFGLPCVLNQQLIPGEHIIGLCLHCMGLVFLGVALYFFIKTSVVRRRIWKIPIIGSTWTRTTNSVRHGQSRSLDANAVMRDTQGRIMFFMLFVVLYQAGLQAVKAIEKQIIDEKNWKLIKNEFEIKTNCHQFSCSPDTCQNTYTFTKTIQNLYLPTLGYSLFFDVLATLLLSFVASPAFRSPLQTAIRNIRIDWGLEVTQTQRKSIGSTASLSDVRRPSDQSYDGEPRRPPLRVETMNTLAAIEVKDIKSKINLFPVDERKHEQENGRRTVVSHLETSLGLESYLKTTSAGNISNEKELPSGGGVCAGSTASGKDALTFVSTTDSTSSVKFHPATGSGFDMPAFTGINLVSRSKSDTSANGLSSLALSEVPTAYPTVRPPNNSPHLSHSSSRETLNPPVDEQQPSQFAQRLAKKLSNVQGKASSRSVRRVKQSTSAEQLVKPSGRQ